MRQLIALMSLCCFAGCSGTDPTEHGDIDASMSLTDVDVPDVHALRRARLMALAEDGFASATVAKQPPPVGTTAPLLRLSRPDHSADELARRLTSVLTAMELEIDRSEALAWAHAATDANGAPEPPEPSISEPSPGLVIAYDAKLDDLMVVNTSLLDMHARVDADIVPWDDARRVARALIDQGVVDAHLSLDGANVAFVRSGVEGPDGTKRQWVDEILFEANLQVEGIDIIEAGIRIGITPVGGVSSVRVTGIEIEHAGRVTMSTTTQALLDAFAEYVMGAAPPFESVQISVRRPVYMLHPNVAWAIVEPRYLIAYSILVRDGAALSSSRSTITLWSMASPHPTIEARLPE